MAGSSPIRHGTEARRGGRILAVAAVLALVGCLAACSAKAEHRGGRVSQGDWQRVVLLNGSLQALKSEEFKVPQTSTWRLQIKWLAREGDEVRPGDKVLAFDTANLAAEIEANQEALRNRVIEMEQKQADLRHQQLELEVERKSAETDLQQKEIDASVPEDLQSRYEYEQKQLEKRRKQVSLRGAETRKTVSLMELRTQIGTMGIEIEDLRRKLKASQDTLDSLVVRAQTGGTFVYGETGYPRRKVQVGDTVFTGQTVATIPDSASYFVQGWISEAHLRKIAAGQKVDLAPDAFPGRVFSGRIRTILANAEPRAEWGRAHYFRVDIELEKLDMKIMKPGMSFCCQVYGERCPGALQVPLALARWERGSFWIKPANGAAIRLRALGHDEFVVAARPDQNPALSAGMQLEPVPETGAGREANAHGDS